MTMTNVVLALLTRTETAPAILAGAERLADLLGNTRIEVMVTRILPISTILVTEEVLPKAAAQKIHDHEVTRATSLRVLFDDWVSSHESSQKPVWIDEEGDTETLVKTWGQRADYIVAGQPDAHADQAEHQALHAAIFASDRPVLMMPLKSKPDFGKTIAIAWRDDKFTPRALLAAMRCLSSARDVHVLMGYKPGSSIPRTPDILTEHVVHVTEHRLPIGNDVFGAQLIATAHEVHADLLVMGAFTHNAWHNMMFGGVTKYVLAHSDVPVLMRH
jgi:nucleotide-binding universal stress UspA family protein